MYRSWFNLAMLAAKSQQVIGLRIIKLTVGGPKACEEANRMVTEKLDAASQGILGLINGATPDSVVSDYRKTVQANSRRLMRR